MTASSLFFVGNPLRIGKVRAALAGEKSRAPGNFLDSRNRRTDVIGFPTIRPGAGSLPSETGCRICRNRVIA